MSRMQCRLPAKLSFVAAASCTVILPNAGLAAVNVVQTGTASSGKVWTEGWTGGVQASAGSAPISGEVAIAVAFGVAWAVFMIALLLLWIRMDSIRKEIDSLGAAIAANVDGDKVPDDNDDDSLSETDGDGSGRVLVLEEIDI